MSVCINTELDAPGFNSLSRYLNLLEAALKPSGLRLAYNAIGSKPLSGESDKSSLKLDLPVLDEHGKIIKFDKISYGRMIGVVNRSHGIIFLILKDKEGRSRPAALNYSRRLEAMCLRAIARGHNNRFKLIKLEKGGWDESSD